MIGPVAALVDACLAPNSAQVHRGGMATGETGAGAIGQRHFRVSCVEGGIGRGLTCGEARVGYYRRHPGCGASAMKLLWFHLMPYTELPDDFREKHPSVWVDIHSSLFDPRRAHHMYNDFMDELEFAAECGFDAICVNEHHSNGYGLMPSPNLIASSLARRTTDTALCVMGNSLALYNPPTRVAEEFAMIDCISGGRLIAGFPVGSPMDTCFAYGQNPVDAARALPRGARPGDEGLDRAGHLRLQRPLQPAALRQHLAAPDPEAASADLDPGRRLGRDLAVVRRDGLRLLLPVVLRLQGRPGDDERLLGRDGAARQGPQSVPRRLPAVRRRRRDPRGGVRALREPAEYFYGRCLHVDPRFAGPPGYATEATQRARHPEPGGAGRRASARATRRSSRCWRARWTRSSTRATSSSARPTRSPSSCARSRPTSMSAT